MAFTEQQKADLAAPLDRANVATREQSGQKLSYVESWHVIAEANRIFGFDGWTRETVDLRMVAERERKIGRNKDRDGWGVSYLAKVRVTVGDIVREGVGVGHGIDADLGQAHESASKEAESDAMKRALMTFGNPFGLALYDKSHSNVADMLPESVRVMVDGLRAAAVNGDVAMAAYWKAHWPAVPQEHRQHVLAIKEQLKAGAALVDTVRAG